ncbi:MAG: DUF1376 domain-containing protein [Rhodospirillales bacterium]|nr:DUF1376 domain-containing protein [Rhodospirillales bacterium]
MARFPFLPLWTDAYVADTNHLTTLEHGAYLLMLMTAWRAPECRLPDDDNYLARITDLSPATWRRHAPVLRAFWQVDDGFLYQKRLSKEREKSASRSESGKNAANAKWRKRKETGDADASPEDCETDASIPIPITIPITKNQNSNSVEDENRSGGSKLLLKAATIEEARKIAPGYDIYHLEARWREWSAGKEVRDPDRAFLGFVRKHVANNPLR